MYHKDLKSNINLRIPPDTLKHLSIIADRRNMNTSDLIRYILKEYILEYLKGGGNLD